jgi:hypothetical protein
MVRAHLCGSMTRCYVLRPDRANLSENPGPDQARARRWSINRLKSALGQRCYFFRAATRDRVIQFCLEGPKISSSIHSRIDDLSLTFIPCNVVFVPAESKSVFHL